jgi:hypothetical protein
VADGNLVGARTWHDNAALPEQLVQVLMVALT